MPEPIELQPNIVIATITKQRNELADKVAYLEAALEQLLAQMKEKEKDE